MPELLVLQTPQVHVKYQVPHWGERVEVQVPLRIMNQVHCTKHSAEFQVQVQHSRMIVCQ